MKPIVLILALFSAAQAQAQTSLLSGDLPTFGGVIQPDYSAHYYDHDKAKRTVKAVITCGGQAELYSNNHFSTVVIRDKVSQDCLLQAN